MGEIADGIARPSVKRIVVGEFLTNCYLLEYAEGCLVVDPGAEGERLSRLIEDLGKPLLFVILTHCHIDHIGAVDDLYARFKMPILLHPLEEVFLQDPNLNLTAFLLPQPLSFSFPYHLLKGDELSEFSLTVLHTPGHTPGSISLLGEDFLISGDTLFAGSVGRTDLPGGDFKMLCSSLKKIASLPSHLRVFPGHGEPTSIGEEKRSNPFLLALPD